MTLEIPESSFSLPFIGKGKLIFREGLSNAHVLGFEASPPFMDRETGKNYSNVHGMHPNFVLAWKHCNAENPTISIIEKIGTANAMKSKIPIENLDVLPVQDWCCEVSLRLKQLRSMM